MTKSEFASKVAELVDGKLDSFVVETPHKGITMKVYAFNNGPHPVGYLINGEIVYTDRLISMTNVESGALSSHTEYPAHLDFQYRWTRGGGDSLVDNLLHDIVYSDDPKNYSIK
tara:strand:+ start:232 stop:573 length:342 start_codon:yes stop_codon:yes gene_type:complete